MMATESVSPSATLTQSQLVCQVRQAWFLPISPLELVRSLFTLGSGYDRQSNLKEAITSYEIGLSILGATNSWGIGASGSPQYSWSVFNRPSLTEDLLPGMDNPIYTDEVVQSMLALAEDYRETGDSVSAIRIYTKIIQVAPDNTTAKTRLAELSQE